MSEYGEGFTPEAELPQETDTIKKLSPDQYALSSFDTLQKELRENRHVSVDLDLFGVGGKLYIGGFDVTHLPAQSYVNREGLLKGILIAKLVENDFFSNGIRPGDLVDFESVRGNIRQLKYTGMSPEGIEIEETPTEGEQSQPKVYYFRAMKGFKKSEPQEPPSQS